MQDIDFDELDRAVSSVMGTPRSEPHQGVDARAVHPSPATTSPTASLATRRSGRFMDVVHPSSDMRSAAPAQPPKEQPVEQKASSTPASLDWPDPLEMTQKDETTGSLTADDDETKTQPLDSPFLSGAKVEKRPLGGYQDEKKSLPPLDLTAALNEEDAPVSAAETASEPLVKDDAVQVSPEADAGAVSVSDLEVSEEALIGANETADTSPDTAASSPVEPEESPAQPKPSVSVSDAKAPMASVSIPQQYKEKAPADDQQNGAIYDTESYHQPLAHPQKKSSGLWVVVWIVGLILIGGGLGAALYFFVLPQL